MKLCKDCVHFQPCNVKDAIARGDKDKMHLCKRPIISPVTGLDVSIKKRKWCSNQRRIREMDEHGYPSCGYDGRFYEPKEHP